MSMKFEGTQLQAGDGADPEVFTTIAGVKSVSVGSISRTIIDNTDLDSGDYRTFKGGLKDGGSLGMSVNFEPTNGTHDKTSGFLSHFDDDDARNYKLVFPDSTEWGFAGCLESFDLSGAMDDLYLADLSIKVSGKPSFL